MMDIGGRERMQKMELQLETLSKWVHMNVSSGHQSATKTTTNVRHPHMKHDEGLVSSSSGTCSSTMSSESRTLTVPNYQHGGLLLLSSPYKNRQTYRETDTQTHKPRYVRHL